MDTILLEVQFQNLVLKFTNVLPAGTSTCPLRFIELIDWWYNQYNLHQDQENQVEMEPGYYPSRPPKPNPNEHIPRIKHAKSAYKIPLPPQ